MTIHQPQSLRKKESLFRPFGVCCSFSFVVPLFAQGALTLSRAAIPFGTRAMLQTCTAKVCRMGSPLETLKTPPQWVRLRRTHSLVMMQPLYCESVWHLIWVATDCKKDLPTFCASKIFQNPLFKKCSLNNTKILKTV